MEKILLVGGAGFIGHHLALNLTLQGYEVEIIDNMRVNHIGQVLYDRKLDEEKRKLYLGFLLERIDMLRACSISIHDVDARNYHKLSEVVEEFQPEVIIHLAAVAHANVGNKDPLSTFDHSLRTLENSLDASRKSVKQFIYFSSSMVYGPFKEKEVSEDTKINPFGVYGCLKACGELMSLSYQQIFKMPYTIIRPSALYGERCISNRVVQIFIESALRGENLKIAGDGQEKLDFTYINDLVNGVISTIGNEKAYNQIFNITFGDSRSILELAQMIVEEVDNSIGIDFIERDKLIPKRGTLNISKARSLLDYSPECHLYEGVKRYIDWYRGIV